MKHYRINNLTIPTEKTISLPENQGRFVAIDPGICSFTSTGDFMNIGSNEFFQYNNKIINRDLNGARNILCFSLVDTPCVINNTAFVNHC